MKPKRLSTGLLALSAFVLSACSSMFYPKGNVLEKIETGMSPKEISALLGKPEYRRLNYELEEWEYRKFLNPLDGEATVIIVRFEDNHLVYMDSFKSSERQIPVNSTPATPPASTPIVVPVRPEHPAACRPTSEQQFNKFYNKVKERPFKDDQMKLLRAGVENKYFTCRQCARMMSLYAFDDDRLEVLRLFAPRIVDKENYDVIERALDSLIERDKVASILGI